MPKKELIEGELITPSGDCCALGSVYKARNVPPPEQDYDDMLDTGHISETLKIARSMVAEIAYMNDEASRDDETPAQRWTRMREWAASQIK